MSRDTSRARLYTYDENGVQLRQHSENAPNQLGSNEVEVQVFENGDVGRSTTVEPSETDTETS